MLNLQRLLWGFAIALLIIGLALAALRFSAQVTGAEVSLPDGRTIILVSALLALVYVIAAFIWHYFLDLTDGKHHWADIVVDIGFLSIGKYFPGKVIGLFTRGSMNNGSVKLSARSALFSFSEQIIALIIGLWFGCLLVMLAAFTGSPVKQATVAIFWIIALPSAVRLTVWLLRHVPLVRRLSHDALPVFAPKAALQLGLGHSAMWLSSAISLLPLMAGNHTDEQLLFIMGAYVISTIAGWLVIIAPAGIGVREAVFTTLLTSIVPWDQAILSITWHRILCVGVDILFGIGCLVIFFFHRTRDPSSSSHHD